MVNRRRGASTMGCLFSILIAALVLYYGTNLGRVWWRYYEILDRMKSAARFAQSQTDAQILHRLQLDVVEIGLPGEAKNFRIRRTTGPLEISIATNYHEKVELPFVNKSLAFHPSVHQRF